jgi:hypothetical protein
MKLKKNPAIGPGFCCGVDKVTYQQPFGLSSSKPFDRLRANGLTQGERFNARRAV